MVRDQWALPPTVHTAYDLRVTGCAYHLCVTGVRANLPRGCPPVLLPPLPGGGGKT